MTKEQLIKFIDKEIPDGDLVNIKAYIGNKRYFLNIVGIDDDSGVGIWNICTDEITPDEDYYEVMIENSKQFEKAGYSMEGKQWFDANK